ncbi:MAG: DNA cytosine methyltransferase [Caldilineaceae bacterium]|nr:DNA cytosine methyltransferase [Caldilineaceae bacterium]
MNELSLFTGAGGGLLATHLLGWKAIGYVEWNEYCQQVIRARIDDGILPVAPIFTDVREFVQSGAAREYRGFADVVTAGFPCQPFSVAGKQLGADDERNMWPATVDVIRAVQPACVFLENVPAIVSSGYIVTVVTDLQSAGYQVVPPLRLSASDVGANHERKRVWIVAYASSDRRCKSHSILPCPHQERDNKIQEQSGRDKQSVHIKHREALAHSDCQRCQKQHASRVTSDAGQCSGRTTAGWGGEWWGAEPAIQRVADGVVYRVERLTAIGNGQVPAVAAAAWRLLAEELQ